MILRDKYDFRINKFCDEEYYYESKNLGININEIIYDLCFRDIKGKNIGFDFYRKIILGGDYGKYFKYQNKELSFIKLIIKVIIDNKIEVFNSEEFKESLVKLLLNCINNNNIRIKINDELKNNINDDIILCINKEIKRSKLIKNSIKNQLDEELWIKVLNNKIDFNKKKEDYDYNIFIEDCFNWGIINEDERKEIEDFIKKKYIT